MSSSTPQFASRIALSPQQLAMERDRIVDFLQRTLGGDPAVCALSGGLDSDVTTRLVVEAIGPSRVKAFIVLQDDFEPRFITNAERLADSVGLDLIRIDLRGMPRMLVSALANADAGMNFRPDGLLDVGRAKCSLRTSVLSTYQDRGFRTIGSSNRTEWLTGFFLPLGDGIGHAQPIFHLYKSQVAQLARLTGTADEVIDQPGSSGFWEGAEDLLDLAFWLHAGGPIRQQRDYTDDDIDAVLEIRGCLSRELIDAVIDDLQRGGAVPDIVAASGLPESVVRSIGTLLDSAAWKHHPLFERLEPLE